jgi:hypothetical protein
VIAQPEVNYLKYVLPEKGVSASPDKVKAVRDYPISKSVKEVRAFLGLASFYRRLAQELANSETAHGVDKKEPTVFLES